MKSKKLNILYVSAEMSPFAKTGGLADVAGSLPKALLEMGHDVRVVMPKYKMIDGDFKYITDFPVQIDDWTDTCIIRKIEVTTRVKDKKKNLPVYFADSYKLFDRDGIYGHFDDAERFVFFSKQYLTCCRSLILSLILFIAMTGILAQFAFFSRNNTDSTNFTVR